METLQPPDNLVQAVIPLNDYKTFLVPAALACGLMLYHHYTWLVQVLPSYVFLSMSALTWATLSCVQISLLSSACKEEGNRWMNKCPLWGYTNKIHLMECGQQVPGWHATCTCVAFLTSREDSASSSATCSSSFSISSLYLLQLMNALPSLSQLID